MKIPRPKINLSLYYLIGAFVLLLPAIYNGFPILYSDVGTYTASGFNLETPSDRPITYGLLLRLFSLDGIFIWGMLCFQAVVILWVIQLFCRTFFSTVAPLRLLLIVILLAIFSPLSWRASELLPDILSPVCLLLILILVFRYNSISKKEKIAGLVIYFVFNATHLSHFMVHIAILTFILVLWLLSGRKMSFSIKNWLILFLCTFNLFLISGSAISKSNAVFQMSALTENGVLYQYLKDECPNHNYALCKCTNSLQNMNGGTFIWSENSPVALTDGWGNGSIEYHVIIKQIFTTPKYLKLFLTNSVNQTWRQFCSFNIGDGNVSFQNGSPPYNVISAFMPSQLSAYKSSRQFKDTLSNILPLWLTILKMVFWFSLLVLPIVLFLTANVKKLLTVSLVIIFTLIANAWIVTAFSCINNRYQSKYTWLVTLLIILMVNDKWFNAKKVSDTLPAK